MNNKNNYAVIFSKIELILLTVIMGIYFLYFTEILICKLKYNNIAVGIDLLKAYFPIQRIAWFFFFLYVLIRILLYFLKINSVTGILDKFTLFGSISWLCLAGFAYFQKLNMFSNGDNVFIIKTIMAYMLPFSLSFVWTGEYRAITYKKTNTFGLIFDFIISIGIIHNLIVLILESFFLYTRGM